MSASVTWPQVVAECDDRIAELTKVCVNPRSADAEIRNAQAAIAECQRLKTLPQRLEASAQQRGNAPKRREY